MNAAKVKGSNWESAIVKWLQPRFPWVERRALRGRFDKGDIAGLAGVVIEAKSISGRHLVDVMSTGLKELQIEVDNADADLGLLCIKRPGFTSPEQAYWIVDPRHVQTLILLIDKLNRDVIAQSRQDLDS